MSRTPAFTYEIKKHGNRPQEVLVNFEGQITTFKFGAHVSKRRIYEMLPKLVMDFAKKRRSA